MIFDRLFKKDKDTGKTTETKPASAVDYYAEGKSQFNAGHYTQAMEYFQAAIAEHPERENAYLKLAETFLAMGKQKEASSTLYKLLARYPDSTQAQEMLKKCQPKPAPEPPQKPPKPSIPPTAPQPAPHKRAQQPTSFISTSGKADWSVKHIIACVVGIVLFVTSVLGIIGCTPVFDSVGWAFLVEFILLALFSICLILSPRLKPSWKAKDIAFMVLGFIIVPISVGFSVDDFWKNGQDLIFALMGALFVLAPFIKV